MDVARSRFASTYAPRRRFSPREAVLRVVVPERVPLRLGGRTVAVGVLRGGLRREKEPRELGRALAVEEEREDLHEQGGILDEGFPPRVLGHLREQPRDAQILQRLDEFLLHPRPGVVALAALRAALHALRRLGGEEEVPHEGQEQLDDLRVVVAHAHLAALVPLERAGEAREQHGEQSRLGAEHDLQRALHARALLDDVLRAGLRGEGEEDEELDRVQRERVVLAVVVRHEEREDVLLEHVPAVEAERDGALLGRIAAEEAEEVLQGL